LSYFADLLFPKQRIWHYRWASAAGAIDCRHWSRGAWRQSAQNLIQIKVAPASKGFPV